MTTWNPHPIVMWELTPSCTSHIPSCELGAEEQQERARNLSTYDAYKTIDQIAALQPRECIFTGGDPLQRSDVAEIIDYARRRGLDPALVMGATQYLTSEAVDTLARHGLTRMVFRVDGSRPDLHEVAGSADTYWPTLRAMRWAKSAGLALEVNTLVSSRNGADLEAIVDLIRPFAVVRWNVHFAVPAAGSENAGMMTAEETEAVFARLARISAREPFAVRAVEAPHYRRFLLQRPFDSRQAQADLPSSWPDFTGYESDQLTGVLDAAIGGPEEFVYVSQSGDVRASEFLPQSAGNLRDRSLTSIYRGSALFVSLRDDNNTQGRCACCEFHPLCVGSRARVWAMTGQLFGGDPLCAYDPGTHDRGRVSAGNDESRP